MENRIQLRLKLNTEKLELWNIEFSSNYKIDIIYFLAAKLTRYLFGIEFLY